MSQRRGAGGLVAAIFAFCLVLAGSVMVVMRPGDVAGLLGVPRPTWRDGQPLAAAGAVLPAAARATPPGAAAVNAALQPLLADPVLGPNVNATVIDVETGQQFAARNPDALTVPASTIKLVTAATALATLGPTHRFRTRAVAGAEPGEVVLIGGGDATLAAGERGSYPDAARLTALAAKTQQALGGTKPTKVTFDASIFSGPVFGPWDSDIPTNGVVSAITGLMVDAGRTDPSKRQVARVPDPDAAAARAFAALLGVPADAVVRGTAPSGGRELAVVESSPLMRQVEIMLTESDNVIAESLARHVAIARQQPATYEGGAAAQRAAIGELGLPLAELQLSDGSGLSRGNRVSPSLLAELVALAARTDRPQLRAVLTGLPVASYNGTLEKRFEKPTAGAAAAGAVRAKTGTLRSVSSVSGVVTTADGRLLAFAILADAVPVGGTGPAQDALDRAVAAIAACGCR